VKEAFSIRAMGLTHRGQIIKKLVMFTISIMVNVKKRKKRVDGNHLPTEVQQGLFDNVW